MVSAIPLVEKKSIHRVTIDMRRGHWFLFRRVSNGFQVHTILQHRLRDL